jgi:hypothetical protein
MKLNDLIARIKSEGQLISGYQVYAKENIESAYIKGAEAELNYMLTAILCSTAAWRTRTGKTLPGMSHYGVCHR